MRVFKSLGLLLVCFFITVRLQSGDESQMYQSLDTLAEILTVAKAKTAVDISGEELIEGAIEGLLEQLDPHSNYYNRDRYKTMKEDQHGTFHGIGIIVGYQNRQLTVVTALDGAPAARAGIRAGDVIAGIDGVDTESMRSNDAVRLLRGEENSQVDLSIIRPGQESPLKMTLQRQEIPTKNVRTAFMFDEKTGYVGLKDFGESATSELSDAISTLTAQKMEQLVLDLRGNPGGLLPQAIGVASLFIPGRKVVVSTQGRLRNANKEYVSEVLSPHEQMPLIVLIDRGSASASEIVAGAIQDHDRGLILGVNSWGKGLVQSVFPLSDGTSGLALTTSRYYTPSGRNIQGNYDSWESYYSPKSSETFFFSEKTSSDSTLFTTHVGRKVYQVRGITPDVYISYRLEPKSIRELQNQAAFFNFATINQERFGQIGRNWRADEGVVQAFRNFLSEKKLEHSDFDEHQSLIAEKLTYQFLLIKGGRNSEEWALQYQLGSDIQMQSAVELFPSAHELLRIFNGELPLREGYSSDLLHYAEKCRIPRETED